MLSTYQNGPRQPANGRSSLAQSTGSWAQATPPSRLSTHGGKPHIAAHTGRPGPQPNSAKMAATVSRWNAETKRVMQEFLDDTRNAARQKSFQRQFAQEERDWADRSNAATKREWEEKPFPSYDPRRGNDYDYTLVTHDSKEPTGYHGHKFGEVWVYTKQIGEFGTLQYAVVNPQTGNLLVFTPEAGIAADKRVYSTESSQVRTTTAGTGVAGKGIIQYGFGGVAGIAFGVAALPYAAAAGVAAAESSAGQVVITGLRLAGKHLTKHFVKRVGTDFAIQFSSGMIKKNGDPRDAFKEVNITALCTAWLLPPGGWAGSVRNAVLKTTVKTNIDVSELRHPRISIAPLPQLNTMEGFANFITAVGLDVIGDRAKAGLVKGVAPVWARSMGSMRQSGSTVGKWVAANRISLGTFGQIVTSTVFKVNKDKEKERMAERYKTKPAAK